MKRSFLMSALVLSLAIPVAACGGGGGSGEPAKDGESGGGEKASSEDPVVELQNISDGIQKDVDAVFQPVKDADAVLESLGKLSADLKAAKSKLDAKKLMAEIQKVVAGGEANLESLKMDDATKAIVTERVEKLKNLMQSLKELDQKAKDLAGRIAEALPKVPAIGAKAIAKIELKVKAPFGVSADDKKKAEEDKAKITAIMDGFKTKAADWQKMATEMPAKAKDLPAKFAKLK